MQAYQENGQNYESQLEGEDSENGDEDYDHEEED